MQAVLPGFVSATIATTADTATSSSGVKAGQSLTSGSGSGAYLPAPAPAPAPAGGPLSGYSVPRFGGASGVGSGDLDPFPGGVHIGGPGRGGGGFGTGGAVGPNGGNLVGPNHPLFDPNGGFGPGGYGGEFGGEYGGYGPGGAGGYGGLPQQRFDPFGPVPGPNTDIGGAGAGNVGVDSRGRPIPGMFPGRLPGRGGAGRGSVAGRGVPGEPQPDHLRPPGW